VIILYLHDQQQQPQWALGITLNAVLALLSTMSKASFMIALAEGISQWKWNLYSNVNNRPIQDFNLGIWPAEDSGGLVCCSIDSNGGSFSSPSSYVAVLRTLGKKFYVLIND
jgi:hypothetical protein